MTSSVFLGYNSLWQQGGNWSFGALKFSTISHSCVPLNFIFLKVLLIGSFLTTLPFDGRKFAAASLLLLLFSTSYYCNLNMCCIDWGGGGILTLELGRDVPLEIFKWDSWLYDIISWFSVKICKFVTHVPKLLKFGKNLNIYNPWMYMYQYCWKPHPCQQHIPIFLYTVPPPPPAC